VAGGVRAGASRECEGDEGKASPERTVAERELQVERAEQEEPEHEPGVDEAQYEATADAPVGEPVESKQRLPGTQLADCEGGEAESADAADAERLG
jgi:hypothetical protein